MSTGPPHITWFTASLMSCSCYRNSKKSHWGVLMNKKNHIGSSLLIWPYQSRETVQGGPVEINQPKRPSLSPQWSRRSQFYSKCFGQAIMDCSFLQISWWGGGSSAKPHWPSPGSWALQSHHCSPTAAAFQMCICLSTGACDHRLMEIPPTLNLIGSCL